MKKCYDIVISKIIWRVTRKERGEWDRMMVESRADREGERWVEWFDWKVGLIDSNFITNETAVEWQASPDGIVFKTHTTHHISHWTRLS